MISLEGVPSSLILRNQSWVRKQAQALSRRLPANVEKADLIQVGLIAVAQSAVSFKWEGDHDGEDAKEAFVRYAQMRVKGAMMDELRQMDRLSRAQRRRIKVLQVAAERWRAAYGAEPTAQELSKSCEMTMDEVFDLQLLAQSSHEASLDGGADTEDVPPRYEPATERDEVEARVDTGMLLRRLEKFFATLPDRDRQVIDSYLGIGLSATELAQSMNVSPSRVSQMFKSVCDRIGIHLGHEGQRSTDRVRANARESFDKLIALREAELARTSTLGSWGEMMEAALTPAEVIGSDADPIEVTLATRWG